MSDNRNSRDIYSSSRPRSHVKTSSGRVRTQKKVQNDGADSGRRPKSSKGKRVAVNAVLSVVLVLCIGLTAVCIKYPNLPTILLSGMRSDNGEDVQQQMEDVIKSPTEDVSYFLITGTDLSGDLTDIIMVVCFNIKDKTANILQIPRDTYIGSDIDSGKVNAVYESAKDGQSRINVMMKRINDYLGLPIDHYAVVSISAFRKIVDVLGGIDVEVPIEMDANDTEEVWYHYEKGWNHLNGGMAEAFVRHRDSYVMGDLGRVQTQRNFYAAFIKEMLGMSLGEMASVADKCYNDIATDMSVGQLLSYASAAKGMSMETISFYAVPGQPGYYSPQGVSRSYYSIHKKEYVELINEYFMPYSDEPLTVDDIKIKELHTEYEPSYLTNDKTGIGQYVGEEDASSTASSNSD